MQSFLKEYELLYYKSLEVYDPLDVERKMGTSLYEEEVKRFAHLCILEICMNKKEIEFTRELFIDNGNNAELTKVAEYTIK